MTDNKQMSCEGYEFNGPITTRNGKGGPMESYRVRRLADNAGLLLTFSSPTFRGRNVQVCKVKPSDGWLDQEYHGCTFMAVNETSGETSDDPDTAEGLGDPRLWSVLWLRDGIPPMKFWPGMFLADTEAEREAVWTLLLEQIEVGIQRIDRSQRDRAGEDTGMSLPEWADKLDIRDILNAPLPECPESASPQEDLPYAERA